MAHRRLEFDMPAPPAVVFDALHQPHWRSRWDPLVSAVRVSGVAGGVCVGPGVGTITEHTGAGLLAALSWRTRFVLYERPHAAAAALVGDCFPFHRWAASVQVRPAPGGGSVLVHAFTFSLAPRALAAVLEPLLAPALAWQARRRFARLRSFVQAQRAEIERAAANR